jgi:hypothetical protein
MIASGAMRPCGWTLAVDAGTSCIVACRISRFRVLSDL